MTWLGIDIGGANLKIADGRGWARSTSYPLWRDPQGLPAALAGLLEHSPPAEGMAITMTGELCDAFRTKSEGVQQILDACRDVAGRRKVSVYLVEGRFAALEEAEQLPELATASNWHALARFACRFLQDRTGLLIDVGSTTTDIVPLVEGRPAPRGWNDTSRLLSGELVYSGVGRTPICAITSWLPWRGERCPVAAELFATSADAYVCLGEMPEQPDCRSTADGRPLSKEFSRERLSRMICSDAATFSEDDTQHAAVRVRDAQLAQLQAARRMVIAHMSSQPTVHILSGAGEFLARALTGDDQRPVSIISLGEVLGRSVSECGPAHAVAVLAGETG